MRNLMIAALSAGLITAGAGAAGAMPSSPISGATGDTITLVAGGCGPGFHRGGYGGCRPNFGGPRFGGPRFYGRPGFRGPGPRYGRGYGYGRPAYRY